MSHDFNTYPNACERLDAFKKTFEKMFKISCVDSITMLTYCGM